MPKPVIFRFRLYVADDTRNSAQAQTNLTALCLAYLPGRYEIEIVDVFSNPQRALDDGIRMTPTLIKLTPLPVQKFVGTLGRTTQVLQSLGLNTRAA